ncbi:GNAT family N-acetyltransferase [Methylocystis echinoides]|uniref:GNAT family N-acetyltransferase n=1 Tax=Methylocystis echinoides TaxID=29468 RepID=UPI0024925C54|nr:GNAT family N-acetyltransferase [Methylocystis echinoides]
MIRFSQSVVSTPSTCLSHACEVWSEISHLQVFYPGFEYWFNAKVASGLRDGSRRVFVERRGKEIAGLAIAKRSALESKLCTLYVAPKFRYRGVAARLANEAFDWLETKQPLFSVPEERLPEFRVLINRWSFVETQALRSFYRNGKIEYVFNGRLNGSC